MDPLTALGLFVGIPLALALVIAVAILVPRSGYRSAEESQVAAGLITSSAAVPNPAALPSVDGTRIESTGGAHGNW